MEGPLKVLFGSRPPQQGSPRHLVFTAASGEKRVRIPPKSLSALDFTWRVGPLERQEVSWKGAGRVSSDAKGLSAICVARARFCGTEVTRNEDLEGGRRESYGQQMSFGT
jgi:hypothetical protein